MSHYIHGSWIEPEEGTLLTRTSPVNGEVIYKGNSLPISMIHELVEKSLQAQKQWQKITPEKRCRFFLKLEEILIEMRQEIVETLILEVGKTLWEAHQEVDACISKITHTIESYGMIAKEILLSNEKKELVVIRKPLGVALVLSPSNFPFHLALGQIAPLLISGNSVILKPSELAPRSGELITRAIIQAFTKSQTNILPSLFQMVQGGKEVGDALVRTASIRSIFFTGSEPVGSHIQKVSLDFPGRMVALEMGGNNPLIISSIKNVEKTIALIILSAYLTSGQRCTSCRRLIVVDTEANKAFIKMLEKRIRMLPFGAPSPTNGKENIGPFMGPLISIDGKNKILKKWETLVDKGAVPIIPPLTTTALQKYPSDCYLNPLLIDTTNIKLSDEEDFGPLLKLIWTPSFESAIKIANETEFGLSASLVSESEKEFQTFFDDVECGIINWNAPTTGASSRAPFGGVGKSGNFRPAGFSMIESCCYPVTSIKDASYSFLESVPDYIQKLVLA